MSTKAKLAPTSLTLASGQRTRPFPHSLPCSPTQITQRQLLIIIHSLPRVKEDILLTLNTLLTTSLKLSNSSSSSKYSSHSNSLHHLNSPLPPPPPLPVVPKLPQSAGRSAPLHPLPLKTTKTTTCPTAPLHQVPEAPTPLSRLITLKLHSTTSKSSSTPLLPPPPLKVLRPPAHRPMASTTCARIAVFPTRGLPI